MICVRNLKSKGDIALDDIMMDNGFCTFELGYAYLCTFEEGLCGFTNDATGNFNWTRYAGRLSFGSTG